jgi:hypothetical protein
MLDEKNEKETDNHGEIECCRLTCDTVENFGGL